MKSIPMRAVNQFAEQEARYLLKSPLLFGALQALEPDARVEVLDLIPANAPLLDYFAQFHCKLYLPGYRDELLKMRVDKDAPEQSLLHAFETGIPLSSNNEATLDLVLLWDLPNYLDKQVLSALTAYLALYSTPHTTMHCYIHTRQAMPAQPGDYRLTPEHTVMVDMTAPWTASSPMYYQALLNKLLSPFRVERGILLANGLQEYILRAS